jgi:hypothetical protein
VLLVGGGGCNKIMDGGCIGKGGCVTSSGRQGDVNKVGNCVEGGQGRDISCCARAINRPHSTGLKGAY